MITDLRSALESLQASTELTRDLLVASGEGSVEAAELHVRLADLVDALASARGALLHAHLEIERLNGRVAELHAQADARARLVRRQNLLFLKEAGAVDSGPYCPHCWDAEERTVALARSSVALAVMGSYRCPSCKAFFS